MFEDNLYGDGYLPLLHPFHQVALLTGKSNKTLFNLRNPFLFKVVAELSMVIYSSLRFQITG